MAKKKYQVVGRVVSSDSLEGIAGARIEAWDKDLLVDDKVGSAVTGVDGSFKIEFDSSRFSALFLDRKPDLFFKVFYDGRLVKSTEDSVLWNIKAGKTEITIEVDIAVGLKGANVMPKKTGAGRLNSKSLKSAATKLAGAKSGGSKPKGPKTSGTPSGGKKGGKKGKGKSPYSSDFVCVVISRKCAIELLTAISLALGSPSPKKKKGKKGGKGSKGGSGKSGGGKGSSGKGGGGKGGGGKVGGGLKVGGIKPGGLKVGGGKLGGKKK